MIKRVLSIIPARGGSKGLPGKNIIDLAGKPLIAWTIEASLKSKYIAKTVVSSDDEEILDISNNYGAEVLKRPNDLASDIATSELVVRHVIDCLESKGEKFDVVILLQPTSPLRTHEDIDNAFEIMFYSESTAVISVCEFDNKVLKSFIKDYDGFLSGIANDKYLFMRRQDLPEMFMPNGAIYIIDIESFNESKALFTSKTLPYSMSKMNSLDIDSQDDLKLAEKILLN